MEERFSEKIKEQISNTVVIPISFPKEVYAKLKKFAKDEACNTYWNAIEKLLWYYEENEGRNVFGMMLFDRIAMLEQRLDDLEKHDDEPKTRTEKLSKKFGKKER